MVLAPLALVAKPVIDDAHDRVRTKDRRALAPLLRQLKKLGPEMDNCIRELALARALLACGDSDGLARRTLEAYARDPRGVLSLHAKTLLSAR